MESAYEQKTELDRIQKKLHNKYIGIEPMLLIAVIAVIIIYYYVFSSLGNNEDGSSSSLKVFFETVLWLLFIFLLLLNGISYIFGIDLIRTIKGILGLTAHLEKDSDVDMDSGNRNLILVDQVFHLPDNKYTYEDSKAICKAYGARLASFDEMTDAYNKGADWCTYGWSDAQMALYPTQKEKWENLQKRKGHEQDCGHPGINGGYMTDGAMTFGVNCYGSKPSITPEEASAMRKKPLYNKDKAEIDFDAKVKFWRSNLSSIELAPFNHNNWSML
jgi:hypothetical protein